MAVTAQVYGRAAELLLEGSHDLDGRRVHDRVARERDRDGGGLRLVGVARSWR